MISTKRLRRKTNEHRPTQAKRGTLRQRKSSAAWMKKSVALTGFLATVVGMLVALLGQPGRWFEKPDIRIEPDNRLSIVNVDGEQFEFQVALTLCNQGQKPDIIHRPDVIFTSDRPIVNCLPDAVFTNDQGKVEGFPVYLPKESSAKLTCIIKWKPTEDYSQWTSGASAGPPEMTSPVLGRIALKWPGRKQCFIERSFILLGAETIREMKPRELRSVVYLLPDEDATDIGDDSTHNAAPSTFLFGMQDLSYRAAGIDMSGAVPFASMGLPTSPVQASKTHYAVKGEVASGKEVSLPNSSEVIVNIRPCGGTAELIVFRAQFRKRFLGALPCGAQIVQVEQF